MLYSAHTLDPVKIRFPDKPLAGISNFTIQSLQHARTPTVGARHNKKTTKQRVINGGAGNPNTTRNPTPPVARGLLAGDVLHNLMTLFGGTLSAHTAQPQAETANQENHESTCNHLNGNSLS